MEKQKFKQTEIGEIPEDWEVVTFSDIANQNIKWSITGGPFGSNLKASDYTSDGIQIIQLQNIGDGYFNDGYQIFTSTKKANQLLSCNIYPSEIILSKMGDPVARACFMPRKAKRYLMASDGIRLVVNEKEFSRKFIHDFINSVYFRERAFKVSTGSTRLRIGLPELKNLKVIKPKIEEQTAIATVLSDTDELITSLDKLIAKKKAIKQGAMQELLTGKKRLHSFSGEWEEKKIGEIAFIKRGASPRPIDSPIWFNEKSIIGWVRISDVTKSVKKLIYTVQKLSELGVRHSRFVARGNLIMSICATVGRPIITELDTCIHDGFVVFLEPKIEKEYIYYFLSVIEHEWGKNGQTGSQMNLNTELINSTKIKFPKSSTEQTAIAKVLSDMDSELESLEKKRDKYLMIKQSMMQQLLTGKIRLI